MGLSIERLHDPASKLSAYTSFVFRLGSPPSFWSVCSLKHTGTNDALLGSGEVQYRTRSIPGCGLGLPSLGHSLEFLGFELRLLCISRSGIALAQHMNGHRPISTTRGNILGIVRVSFFPSQGRRLTDDLGTFTKT